MRTLRQSDVYKRQVKASANKANEEKEKMNELLTEMEYITRADALCVSFAVSSARSTTASMEMCIRDRCLLSEVQPGTDRLSLHRAAQSHATVRRSGVRTVQDLSLIHI